MKKLLKMIAVSVAAATIMQISCCAQFIHPYTYELPLESMANDDDTFKALNTSSFSKVFDMSYVTGYTDASGNNMGSYDNDENNKFLHCQAKASPETATSVSMQHLFIMKKGGYTGYSDNVVGNCHGVMTTQMRFRLTPSVLYSLIEGRPEAFDIQWVGKNSAGTQKTILSFREHYWVKNRTQKFYLKSESAVSNGWGGEFLFGKWYTIKARFDVPNKKVSAAFYDEYGNQFGNPVSGENVDIASMEGGWFLRSTEGVNIDLDDVITERETFITKNITYADNGTTLDASLEIANDLCGDETNIGPVLTDSPILLVGQFDREDRLLKFDVKQITVPKKAGFAASPIFTPYSISTSKVAGFDHAKAVVWNNANDMIPYCDLMPAQQ